jgi:hypothetical protein
MRKSGSANAMRPVLSSMTLLLKKSSTAAKLLAQSLARLPRRDQTSVIELPIVFDVLGRAGLPGVPRCHARTFRSQPPTQLGVGDQIRHGIGESFGIRRPYHADLFAVGQVFLENGDVRGDHGQASGHRLEDREAPALFDGREHESIRRPVPRRQVRVSDGTKQEEVSSELQPKICRSLQDLSSVARVVLERVLTHNRDHWAGKETVSDSCQRLDQVKAAFPRFQSADREEKKPLRGLGPGTPGSTIEGGRSGEPSGVYAVDYHCRVYAVLLSQQTPPVVADHQHVVWIKN